VDAVALASAKGLAECDGNRGRSSTDVYDAPTLALLGRMVTGHPVRLTEHVGVAALVVESVVQGPFVRRIPGELTLLVLLASLACFVLERLGYLQPWLLNNRLEDPVVRSACSTVVDRHRDTSHASSSWSLPTSQAGSTLA